MRRSRAYIDNPAELKTTKEFLKQARAGLKEAAKVGDFKTFSSIVYKPHRISSREIHPCSEVFNDCHYSYPWEMHSYKREPTLINFGEAVPFLNECLRLAVRMEKVKGEGAAAQKGIPALVL